MQNKTQIGFRDVNYEVYENFFSTSSTSLASIQRQKHAGNINIYSFGSKDLKLGISIENRA